MEAQQTSPKVRKLTVCNKGFDREYGLYVSFPVIQLCGKWLQDSGFRAGHTIDITYQDGKIIITKSEVQRFNDI